MLQVLGRNRILLLLILILLNVGAAYGTYQYLIPRRTEAQANLDSARSALEQKRQEIQKLKEEYAILQNQLTNFKELEAIGFFNDQGRVEAQASFEKLRTVSGVLKAKYDILAGQLMEDQRASDAGYVILKSPIKVELDSLDDVDVYSFLKLIQEKFPGKVDITSMEISKTKTIDPQVLRDIAAGKPVAMIKSKVEFEWRTMASRQSLSPDTEVEHQSSTPGTPTQINATLVSPASQTAMPTVPAATERAGSRP